MIEDAMFTDFVGFVQTVKIYDAGVSKAWVAFDVDLPRNNLAGEKVVYEYMGKLPYPFHVVLAFVEGGDMGVAGRDEADAVAGTVRMVGVTREGKTGGLPRILCQRIHATSDDSVKPCDNSWAFQSEQLDAGTVTGSSDNGNLFDGLAIGPLAF
jgi:hypothetical protein